MQVARITKVYVDPVQATDFLIEVWWRYGTSGPFLNQDDAVGVYPDGTLQNPVEITFDETVNNSIDIRYVFVGCNSTPYIQSYTV